MVNILEKLNGGWQKWVVGIVGTLVGTLIINDIAFQRDTREQLSVIGAKLKFADERETSVIKHLEQRIDERTTIPFNRADADRELHQRDMLIQRLEQRIEALERHK